MVKILVFAGSARKDSVNKKLAAVAAEIAASAGADVTLIDLADFSMPLFNQDLEDAEGMPPDAGKFKRLMIESDGYLIASPEHNSSFSALLKNAIDWASRAEAKDEPPLSAYRGKVAALMAASPGGLGGLRGLVMLRMLLGNLGVLVIPKQHAMSSAYGKFDDQGQLNDEKQREAVTAVVDSLITTAKKMSQ